MKIGQKLSLLTPSSGSSPGAADASVNRTETLEDLREKMAAILGRPGPPPPKRADPARTELPFIDVDTPAGVLCRRLEILRASHHVGRIPVEAARDAEPTLVALLSLDPSLSDVDLGRALFVDTETTGLGGGAGTLAFLVGLAFFDGDGRLVVEQLFVRAPGAESPMLEHLAGRMADATCLVTFNGKAFDLPLLEGRFVMNRLTRPPRKPHLDLVHVARRLHKQRIGKCTLKSVERNVLGFEREGDIDGFEVAPRYAHFLRTGDETALSAVVDHNFWDVISMAALVGLYGEPVGALDDRDLVGLASTLHRARALDRALRVADAAVARGVGAEALRVRGRIAKARGDRARALSDFEALAEGLDDPAVRLELAKLYEHYVKEPKRALALLDLGTDEAPCASERRRARLERKIEKANQPRPEKARRRNTRRAP